MGVSVRGVETRDAAEWMSLYAGYRAFYRLPDDPASVATTWRWVSGGEHGLVGIVAVDDGDRPIALANLRWFARPSSATRGLYLDDLFTAEHARGRGAATALLAHAAALAGDGDASVVRWITASDNAAARALYDTHATATPWVTYDMRPSTAT